MTNKFVSFLKEFGGDVVHVYKDKGILHTTKIFGLLYLYYGLLPTINLLVFMWVWWLGLIMSPFTYLIVRNVRFKN